MEPEAQLEWEARAGRLAGAAALGSALLTIASIVIQVAAIGERPDDEREALLQIDEYAGALGASLAVQILSYLLLAYALYYLLRATVARRPEVTRIVLPVVLLAPLLLAIGGILDQIDVRGVSDDFVSSGAQTEQRAEDLLEDRSVVGSAMASAGTLTLAISFVLVSLNAMRAGLLSRFMGILGVIVGTLLVLPLVPGGQVVIQAFWMIALGALFLDRWPNGRGPAWSTGRADPWPTAEQRRDEATGRGEPARDALPDPGPEPAAGTGGEHPVSKKRKRKRRR